MGNSILKKDRKNAGCRQWREKGKVKREKRDGMAL